MSREDTIVQSQIASAREDLGYSFSSVEVNPEEPYDHYSNRGVADLYIRAQRNDGTGQYCDSVYEVKSAAAVKQATGANEIIRQFNRMRRYFYQDDSHHWPHSVHFELTFGISEATVKHVADNYDLYAGAESKNVSEFEERFSDSVRANTLICFRSLDYEEGNPVIIRRSIGDSLSEVVERLGSPGAPGEVRTVLSDIGYL